MARFVVEAQWGRAEVWNLFYSKSIVGAHMRAHGASQENVNSLYNVKFIYGDLLLKIYLVSCVAKFYFILIDALP